MDDPKPINGPLLASDGVACDEARLLVRVFAEPAGFVRVPLTDGRLDEGLVLEIVAHDLGARVDQELRIVGAPLLAKIRDGCSCAGVAQPTWTGSARDVPVSVIVCTRNRSADLKRCLESLERLQHENLEVLVVDNAPVDESTARLVGEMSEWRHKPRYVREDRPGLSCARNRGMYEASGEILAYTDDDTRVDPLWVAGLLRGFNRHPDIACVTGLTTSVRLERAVEQYSEARAWWLSSCDHRVITATRGPRDSRLHPYDAYTFGTGANVAFRAAVIREVGGFDECLGAGTPTAGGEDLDAFVRVLLAGYRLSYEPVALVWHEHRVTESDLKQQMYGRGKGLAAYLCKYLLSRRSGPEVATRFAYGLWHLAVLTRRSRAATDRTVVGNHVLGSELWGLLVGPLVYLNTRHRYRLTKNLRPASSTREHTDA